MENLGSSPPERDLYPVTSEDGQEYYLTNDPKQKEDVLSTLKKIESILKNNINYSKHNPEDKLQNLSSNDLSLELKKMTEKISQDYIEENATNKQKNIIQTINDIQALKKRIDNLISPASALGYPFPPEIVTEIMTYLGFPELLALTQLNRQSRDIGKILLRKKAEEYGYKPDPDSDTDQELLDYFRGLVKEIETLRRFKIVEKQFEELTTDEILKLMVNPEILRPHYPQFREALVRTAMKNEGQMEKKLEELTTDEILKLMINSQTLSPTHPRLKEIIVREAMKTKHRIVEEKLENLTTDEILKLMVNFEILSPPYTEFRKALMREVMKDKHQTEIEKIQNLKAGFRYLLNYPYRELEKKLIIIEDEILLDFLITMQIARTEKALTVSALAGSEKIFNFCLARAGEYDCTSALESICSEGKDDLKSQEMIRLLINKGADVDRVKDKIRWDMIKVSQNIKKFLDEYPSKKRSLDLMTI